jgi:hypothetical protein
MGALWGYGYFLDRNNILKFIYYSMIRCFSKRCIFIIAHLYDCGVKEQLSVLRILQEWNELAKLECSEGHITFVSRDFNYST